MTFAGMRNGEIVSQIESTKTPNDIRLARSQGNNRAKDKSIFFDEIGLNICKEHFRQLIPLEQHKLTAGTATEHLHVF